MPFHRVWKGWTPRRKETVRQAYDEWREALDLDDPDLLKIHRAWIELVLEQGLEFDENGAGDVLKSAEKLPETVRCELPEHGVSFSPDFAVINGQEDL